MVDEEKSALGKIDTQCILAVIWSLFAMLYLFMITFGLLPVTTIGQRYADTILGFLMGTVVAGVLTYYFGSSIGSAKKQDVITQQLPAKKSTP